MNAMIRSLADKLTDISNIEKKTYGELADLKETVLHMSEEVDRVVNEQVHHLYLTPFTFHKVQFVRIAKSYYNNHNLEKFKLKNL